MTSTGTPPRTPREACRFGLREALAYDGLCALAAVTGWWRYPAERSGDLEDMTFLDRVYWIYKSERPIRRAVRASGLEARLAAPREPLALPDGFTIERSVRLSAAGDLMDHAWLEGSAATLYRDVEDVLFDADVVMANLEGVAQPTAKVIDMANLSSAPPLGLAPRRLDVLTGTARRRYDFLATASNHSLDFGADGVAATIAALRERGIAFHGVNETEADAERTTILERHGVRLAVVSHTFGTNAQRPPPDRPRLVNHTKLNRAPAAIDLGVLRAQLAHAAASGADFVIAQLHWGMEFELYPRPAQVEVAHTLAEAGVDLILGHHPHVLQPVEHYRTRRDPERVVPIFYSLGNLTNPFAIPWMCRSGIARLELASGTARDGVRRTYVRSARVQEIEQVADARAGTLRLRSV